MKLSTIIEKLQEKYDKYGDMQVYAFDHKIGVPHVYRKGVDEYFICFSRE